ncbi:hypothetical protein ACN4EG_21145 [Alkalinema pantanalense CENA528]|uniref:hypothetical protein n=1 Tax=Alkalinema pantanalense TaxID=1620705 RepID=UPI003D6E1D7B
MRFFAAALVGFALPLPVLAAPLPPYKDSNGNIYLFGKVGESLEITYQVNGTVTVLGKQFPYMGSGKVQGKTNLCGFATVAQAAIVPGGQLNLPLPVKPKPLCIKGVLFLPI